MTGHYYFGPAGYMVSDTRAPDGQQVNESAAGVMDGVSRKLMENAAGAEETCIYYSHTRLRERRIYIFISQIVVKGM